MDNFLNDEEYNALQACCIKGGADSRALPHYIKALTKKAYSEGYTEGFSKAQDYYLKPISKKKMDKEIKKIINTSSFRVGLW